MASISSPDFQSLLSHPYTQVYLLMFASFSSPSSPPPPSGPSMSYTHKSLPLLRSKVRGSPGLFVHFPPSSSPDPCISVTIAGDKDEAKACCNTVQMNKSGVYVCVRVCACTMCVLCHSISGSSSICWVHHLCLGFIGCE